MLLTSPREEVTCEPRSMIERVEKVEDACTVRSTGWVVIYAPALVSLARARQPHELAGM